MDKLLIRGGRPLHGEVVISGAKNAALPLMAASLLLTSSDGQLQLANTPALADIRTMQRLLTSMGLSVEREGDVTRLRVPAAPKLEAPYDIVKTMRGAVLVLGPMLARHGRARVSLPGGCAIGQRPVDQHIKGLQAMGAQIHVEHGYIVAEAKRLQGARIYTDMITVTGTENLLMAAVLAEGETLLENAAQEPEVTDLCHLLIKMGARIEGVGTSVLRVQGVERLHGTEHVIIPDRIETGTFCCAVAATGGEVRLKGCVPQHSDALLVKLAECGCTMTRGDDWLHLKAPARPRAVSIRTSEYPGFATDMQAQFMAVNCVAEGVARVTETIFENRFMHVQELARLGAHITIEGNTCLVEGVPELTGASVMATDLRASAGLVIAGLVAQGETLVDRIYHLDRGYARMEDKLRQLGADIERRA